MENTILTEIESLKKRVDKHGIEIDNLDDRVHKLESNQNILEVQLQAIEKLQESVDKLNDTVMNINNTVVETKHKLEMVSKEQEESRERIKALETQRNIDHNEKPLGRYEKAIWIALSLLIGSVVTIVLAKIGL